MTIEYHLAAGGHPGTPDWIFDALGELTVAISLEQFGEDTSQGTAAVRAYYADQVHARKGVVLALPGPAPIDRPRGRFGLPEAPVDPTPLLGTVEFSMPLADNQHLLDDGWVQVRQDVRRQRVGTALWNEVSRIAREHGRTTLLGWTNHRIGEPNESPEIVPTTGSGVLPNDSTTRFAQSLGLTLEQVERESRLQLPVPADHLRTLWAQAEAYARPRYRLESWAGSAPERHLEGIAALQQAISTDAPTGGVAWEGEVWDAARVRRREQTVAQAGTSFVTIAVEEDTGEVAGLTSIVARNEHPHRPDQWETVVASAHRGHRLGLWIKVANLALLERELPGARFVRTWNADENDRMLAINTALGFRPYALGGAWQTSPPR